jgi:hypothetical protein
MTHFSLHRRFLQQAVLPACYQCFNLPRILIGHPVDFKVAEKPQIFVILPQSDLKHVLIELLLLTPFVQGILHSVILHTFNGLEGDTCQGPGQETQRVHLIFVIPEGPRGQLQPSVDEIRFHTWLETVDLSLT